MYSHLMMASVCEKSIHQRGPIVSVFTGVKLRAHLPVPFLNSAPCCCVLKILWSLNKCLNSSYICALIQVNDQKSVDQSDRKSMSSTTQASSNSTSCGKLGKHKSGGSSSGSRSLSRSCSSTSDTSFHTTEVCRSLPFKHYLSCTRLTVTIV